MDPRFMKIDPDQPLTAKQESFCRNYLIFGDGTKAAKAAGYKNPESSAKDNLQKPNVRKHLQAISAPIIAKEEKAGRDKRAVLWKIIEDADATNADICRALEILNKMDGVYVNKSVVQSTSTVDMSTLSASDLRALAGEIKAQNESN